MKRAGVPNFYASFIRFILTRSFSSFGFLFTPFLSMFVKRNVILASSQHEVLIIKINPYVTCRTAWSPFLKIPRPVLPQEEENTVLPFGRCQILYGNLFNFERGFEEVFF